ncbi:MAG TPA: sigma-70 family RNA polymerase sigma factor [Planctomycetaceae bacterium]|nr:sigma-70 family RNA polymerase sigma factor [Planctomycetaceae bacterium]
MTQYKNPAIRQLKDQQVRYAPRDMRIAQIERAEELLNEINSDETYRYQDLCKRITSYRPEMYPDLVLTGAEASHDLRLFVEDLSDSANIPAESVGEEVLTVDEVSRHYNVSTKTVDRWRSRGLVSRRFMFGNRKRVGFLKSSLERFVRKHPEDIRRGTAFSQLSEHEREEIIYRARRLARAGACPAEISRRLAQRLGRSPETIRYTLKNYDKDHNDSPVFPNAAQPLSEAAKFRIFAQFRQGIGADRLAQNYCRTKASIYRIISEVRARQLLDQPIEFIFSPEFENASAVDAIVGPPPVPDHDKKAKFRPPPGLPPYLSSLYNVPLLSKDEEVYYFRKMNYLKFAAARMRDQLDVTRAKSRDMDQIESLLDQAVEIKNLLIRSNLRLVVSIAKRHIKPTSNFFEMVSDGNMSLIRAIEKFDYSKGNKFSTYASWAIMKNFARSIPAEHTQLDRFRTGNDELFQASQDARSDQFEQELVNHRQHQVIMSILDQLDEREREISMYRFGLNEGSEPQTLEQVGSHFGVTKERIRQLESRALGKLRKIAEEGRLDIPGI